MSVPHPTRPGGRWRRLALVAAFGASLPALAGPGAAAAGPAAPGQPNRAARQAAQVDDLGGVSGVVLADSGVENLCVVARSADGTSPAVKSRTFVVPGIENPLFAIGVLPGTGLPAGTWDLRGLPCDGSATTPSTPRFSLDGVRVNGASVSAGLRLVPDEETAAITGTVVDADQAPVEGACVTAVGVGETATGGAATSDAEGAYAMDGLPPGEYQVMGQGCGSAEGATDLRGAAVDEDGVVRSVQATGDGAEGITVVLAPGRRVTGRLVDGQGGGVGGVCVDAGDRSAVTEAGGTFELRGVAAEAASLGVNTCEDGQGVVAQRVDLPAGSATTADLDRVVVRRAGSVEGAVSDGDRLPVAGLRVTARTEPDGPDVATAVSDGLGRYRLTGLAPGPYVVVVNPDESQGLPTAWSTEDGVTDTADSAAPRQVGADAPVRIFTDLGEPTASTDLTVSVTPVEDAAITVGGIRRGNGPVTLPLSPGDNLVEFGDVTGFGTPDNVLVEAPAEGGGEDREIEGSYVGPFVRLTAEVPETASPVEVNGRPVGSGRVSFLLAPDDLVEVCAAGQCLPSARAADLQGRVLRPEVVQLPAGPVVRAIALGANSTVLDAEVSLDGDVRAIGQVLLPVDAGEATVEFGDVPGYLTPLPHRIQVGAAGEIAVVARYQRLAPSTIDTGTEDATVWVDGAAVGTGAVAIGLRPGTRRVCADLEDAMACTSVEASGGSGLELGPDDLTGG